MGWSVDRKRYPTDWPAISHAVKQRAGWRCEHCNAPHLAWGWRDAQGQFHEVSPGPLRDAGYVRPPFSILSPDCGMLHIIEIVLAAAHLDHDPSNRDPDLLRALCQRCHVLHDAAQHVASAAATRRRQMQTLDLFENA